MAISHCSPTHSTREGAGRLEHHFCFHRQFHSHVRRNYTNSPEDDRPFAYDHSRSEQRNLSRREHDLNSYEVHRRKVAKVKRHRRDVSNYQQKVVTWFIKEYDVMFVDELDIEEMSQSGENARKKETIAWLQFVTFLRYKGDLLACVCRSHRRNGKGRDDSLKARYSVRRLQQS